MIDSIPIVPRELLEALANSYVPVRANPTVPAGPTSTTKGSPNESPYTSRLLIERWLNDRGIAYRVKAEPDGKGRTVYVLKCCPFNPDHGDPDSCIMQEPGGKLSAHCFHNGCVGQGWQHFKRQIGPPDAQHYDPPLATKTRKRKPKKKSNVSVAAVLDQHGQGDGPPDDGREPDFDPNALPTIQGNKRQLREITEDAYQAILAGNNPPTVFVRGEVLTRIRIAQEDNTPTLEPLTDNALRGILARVADWTKLRDTQSSEVEEEAAPPMDAVKDLATLPDWPQIPVLDAIIETPVYSKSGTLVVEPGYHAEAKLWYHPAANLELPGIQHPIDSGQIEWARDFLLEELLGDFPFKDQASRATALAALLLPFVRRLIEGPTPLHLFDAPVEGTGKTLLAMVISIMTTGRDVEAIAEASCDEEWRKRITSVLAEGPTIILLDNINRPLDSGALAAVLTSRIWKDRILGVSKTVRLPNNSLWIASGNNTRLSREMIRRTVWCRLDAQTDVPWERQNFRHPNLIRWVREHRGKLISAALTLCRCWMEAGRPSGTQKLGMFEGWTEVMGGILDAAGVPGLLANAQDFRSARADQAGEWRSFIQCWWDSFQDQKVGVEDLFDLVTREKLLGGVLGDKGDRSQRIRLGLALTKSLDRVYVNFRLLSGGEDHKARQLYYLQRCGDESRSGADTHFLDAFPSDQ